MCIGVYGGSFDPVHYGHLLLAECCREQLALEQVWFLPADVPPHKQHRALASSANRVAMLELAIAGHEGFSICKYELQRGGVNYTVDTLAYLKEEDPARELYFLMGADALVDLATWKEPSRLCQLAVPVVVFRADPGRASEPLDLTSLEALLSPDQKTAMRESTVQMPRIDLSSSDIRDRVGKGASIRYRTPRAVEKFIETHGLYRHVDS